MKLFKLFALSLAALPSLVVGMEPSVVMCEGTEYDLSKVKFEDHREAIKLYVERNMLKKHHLDYILAPECVEKLTGFGCEKFLNGRMHYYARFTRSNQPLYVFWDNDIPMPSQSWYGRSFVIGGAACLAAIAITGAIYKRQIMHFVSDSEYAREKMHIFSQHYPRLASIAYWAKDMSAPLWYRVAGLFSR